MAKFGAQSPNRRCKTKKLAIGIIIAILIFSVLSMLGSSLVYGIMFARREITPDSLELCYEHINTDEFPRTEHRFVSGDNILQGYLYGEDNKNGIIIIVHGIGGGADSHLAETLDFVDRGWKVFSFDGTGSRESEGKNLVGFSQMNLDLSAAIEYVISHFPEENVFLYGHSMGAYASATVLDNYPEIKAAALLAGFNEPVETMYYHAALRVGPLATIEYPFLVLHNKMLFGDAANESAVSSINKSNIPVLIIQGSNDNIVDDNISIYSKRELISNPNANYLYLDDDFRNMHSTLWRSMDAAKYLTEKQDELTKLRKEYGSPLSGEILKNFIDDLDRDRLFTLDSAFMEEISRFFLNNAA